MRRPCTSWGSSTFLGWLLAGQGWEAALTVAIAVLIITCPCALALAVPAVQVAATGRLFGKGVLVKAADGLERLAEVDTVVFDKTGTLTLGEPALAAQRARHRCRPGARGQPRGGEPASLCARRGARGRGGRSAGRAHAADVREVAGFGLERTGPDGVERLGSAAWCGAEAPDGDTAAVWYRAADGTTTALHFEDRLRPDAADVDPAPARGRLPHGAAVGRPARRGRGGGHPIGHRPLDGRRAARRRRSPASRR